MDAAEVAVVFKRIKEAAVLDLFKPAGAIVEATVASAVLRETPLPNLPPLPELQRIANRKRCKIRPSEPTNIDFDVDESFIPADFLRADIRCGRSRHLIFATEQMLALLSKSRTWYMDGTFSLVKKPFMQLYSIHVFIKNGEFTKQVPVMFSLMSSKRQVDYEAVFRKINDIVSRAVRVHEFVLDFEQAVWQAIRTVFPNAVVQGCAFHWSQAVWRKMQSLGLQVPYRENRSVHKHCRRVLGLPLIPADQIRNVFNRMMRHLRSQQLIDLYDYIDTNWVQSNTWPPESWSVYNKTIRSNNDVEGYHQRLTKKGNNRHSLPFYVIVPLNCYMVKAS